MKWYKFAHACIFSVKTIWSLQELSKIYEEKGFYKLTWMVGIYKDENPTNP